MRYQLIADDRGRLVRAPGGSVLSAGQGINTSRARWEIGAVVNSAPSSACSVAIELRWPRSGRTWSAGVYYPGEGDHWSYTAWSWDRRDIRYGRQEFVRDTGVRAESWLVWQAVDIWASASSGQAGDEGGSVGFEVRFRPDQGVNPVDLSRDWIYSTAGGQIRVVPSLHTLPGLSVPVERSGEPRRVASLQALVAGRVLRSGEVWEASLAWAVRP